MKKLILILFILIICSCTTTETDVNNPTYCPPTCSGGSQGVITTIDSPRDEVYVGSQMGVSIGLEDRGESSVEEGEVCITGLKDFLELSGCQCQSFDITIDNVDDVNFMETRVEYPTVFVSNVDSNQQITVFTKYKYSTYGVYNVCLTGDPYEETECSVSGNKLTTSSSGPLKVSSVEERITPVGGNSIELRLIVEVQKDESVNEKLISFDDISSSSCVSLVEPEVEVSMVLFNEASDCGTLKFEEDEDTAEITCERDVNYDTFNDKKEYEGWIKLDYGYQEINSVVFDVIED